MANFIKYFNMPPKKCENFGNSSKAKKMAESRKNETEKQTAQRL